MRWAEGRRGGDRHRWRRGRVRAMATTAWFVEAMRERARRLRQREREVRERRRDREGELSDAGERSGREGADADGEVQSRRI